MKIFIKYIAKCMMEKKLRFVLLIIAISLSTGMFVASMGAVNVGINSMVKPALEQFEGQEIVITPNDKNQLFGKKEDIKLSGVKNLKAEIVSSAVENSKNDNEDTKYVTVRAREKDNIDKKQFVEGNNDNFEGNSCIISKRISSENKLKINDKVKIFMNGKEEEYTIKAISANEGIFYPDSKKNYSIIVPYKTIAEEFKAEGKYNFISVKGDKENIKESIKEFNKNNPTLTAKELFNEDAVKEQMSSFTAVLYVMMIIVAFMSAIIIYGSFKLIVTERLSVIGTFLSQGATRGKVEKILFLESLGYGIVGGVVGNLFGILGLYLVNYLTSPLKEYGIIEKLAIDPKYLAAGMIFAIVLSFISAIVPVKKIKKMQVKDIILNEVSVTNRIGYKKFIVGAVIMAVSIIINNIKSESVYGLCGVFVVLSVVGIVLMYPKIVDVVSAALYKLIKGKSKAAVFALNNLRTSKVLLSNVTLIIISLLSIFMMTSVSTSVEKAVTGAYKDMNYDLCISDISSSDTDSKLTTTDKIISEVKKNPNIKSNIIHTIQASAVINSSNYIVEGIDDNYETYNKYFDLTTKYKDEYENFLKSDDSIMLTTAMNKVFKANVGDKVSVKVNGITKKLTVAGVINGKLYNMGQIALVRNCVLKDSYQMKEANQLYLYTDENHDIVKKQLKSVLKKYGVSISTVAEDQAENTKANNQMLSVLSIFSYMAIFIAALGIFNNISIGFIQRKKEITVLKSVGMSRGKTTEMIIIESILSVVWAVVISLSYVNLGLSLLSKFLNVLNMPLDIAMNFKVVPQYFIASLVIILIATIPSLIKNRKLSIIQEIRYE